MWSQGRFMLQVLRIQDVHGRHDCGLEHAFNASGWQQFTRQIYLFTMIRETSILLKKGGKNNMYLWFYRVLSITQGSAAGAAAC
jgi:hypothetical protein